MKVLAVLVLAVFTGEYRVTHSQRTKHLAFREGAELELDQRVNFLSSDLKLKVLSGGGTVWVGFVILF